MDTLNDSERAVLDWARMNAKAGAANAAAGLGGGDVAGWRYHSPAELLLDVGRLFTPSPTPPADLGTPGTPRECFRNASEYADAAEGAVYVEGLAARAGLAGVFDCEHGWCATGEYALDPTWTDGAVYLGVPFTDAFRREYQQRHGWWSLLWSPPALDLLRHGVPVDALADVGRPLPRG